MLLNFVGHFSLEVRSLLLRYVNHMLYWYCMSPNPTNASRYPNGSLAADINTVFGSFEKFVSQFNAAAGNLFGSGYVWLVRNKTDGLFTLQSPALCLNCVRINFLGGAACLSQASRLRRLEIRTCFSSRACVRALRTASARRV